MTALLEQQLVALLVQVLEKLDEKVSKESEGVLAIIENMYEFKNKQVCEVADSQGLLPWLLKCLQVMFLCLGWVFNERTRCGGRTLLYTQVTSCIAHGMIKYLQRTTP